MHRHALDRWQHPHDFAVGGKQGERATYWVAGLTAAMMAVEIVAGIAFGSMALLADGWHMSTHVAAFGITIFAYRYARTHAKDAQYTFGLGKATVLGGFASAVGLAVVAVMMAVESVARILAPLAIRYNEAILVAVVGGAVNCICAVVLHRSGEHEDDDEHHGHEHDHNLRAAYFHVLADALTSLLAIVGLLAAKHLRWATIDPVIGIVGSLVILRWAYRLLRETGPILLDNVTHEETKQAVQAALERDSDTRVADLHVWLVGPRDLAVVVSLVTHFPKEPEHYKALLAGIDGISHVTVEVNRCCTEPSGSPNVESV
jgi:cation diffusion facilitator family transporter